MKIRQGFWRTALSFSTGNWLWIQIVQEAQLLHQLISVIWDPRLTEYLHSLTKLIGDLQQAGTQIKNYFQISSITFPESIPRRIMASSHSLQPQKFNL